MNDNHLAKEAIGRVKVLLHDVMAYDVDDLRLHRNIGRSTSRDYWSDLYVDRGEILNGALEQFLLSTFDVLVLSGPLGAGKSTFIRHQAKYSAFSSWVVIDLRVYAHDLRQFGDDPDILLTIVRNNVLEELIASMSLAIAQGMPEDKLQIPAPRSPDDAKHDRIDKFSLNLRARQALAVAALFSLDSGRLLEASHELGLNLPIDADSELISTSLRKVLNSTSAVARVLNGLTWRDSIQLAESLSEGERQIVVCFDNVDSLSPEISSRLLEHIIAFSDSLARSGDIHQDFPIASTKFVVAVRDENVGRLSSSGRSPFRTMHIRIGSDEELSDGVRPLVVLNDVAFAQRVVDRRTRVLEQELVDNPYVDILARSSSTISSILDGLLRGNNYSIRMMLFQVSELMFNLVSAESKAAELRLSEGVTEMVAIKSRLVSSMFSSPRSSAILGRFAHELQQEQQTGVPSISRQLLSYLSCLEAPAKVSTIVTDMGELLGFGSDEIFAALFELYASPTAEAELVWIQQKYQLNSARDIDRSATIRLTARGQTMLSGVLVDFEFFRVVTNQTLGETSGFAWPDLTMTELIVQARLIVDFCTLLVRTFIRYWTLRIAPQFVASSKIEPYVGYTGHYEFGGRFYVDRVISSHQLCLLEILRWLIIRSENVSNDLMVRAQERCRHRSPTDEDIETFVRALGNDSEIGQLWSLVGEYSKMKLNLAKLKSLTRSDLLKGVAKIRSGRES